jgi:hypothetical protein
MKGSVTGKTALILANFPKTKGYLFLCAKNDELIESSNQVSANFVFSILKFYAIHYYFLDGGKPTALRASRIRTMETNLYL